MEVVGAILSSLSLGVLSKSSIEELRRRVLFWGCVKSQRDWVEPAARTAIRAWSKKCVAPPLPGLTAQFARAIGSPPRREPPKFVSDEQVGELRKTPSTSTPRSPTSVKMPPKKVVRPAQENISLGPQYVVPLSPRLLPPELTFSPGSVRVSSSLAVWLSENRRQSRMETDPRQLLASLRPSTTPSSSEYLESPVPTDHLLTWRSVTDLRFVPS